MGEIMNASLMPKNKTKLTLDEANWMDSFNITDLAIDTVINPMEVRELRMDQTQFDIWIKERKTLNSSLTGH